MDSISVAIWTRPERISAKLLIASKIKSIIYQYEFNGGVAQLVRAQDS